MSHVHNDTLLVHRIILDPDAYKEHEYYRPDVYFFNEYIDGTAGIDPQGLRLEILSSNLLSPFIPQLDQVDPSYLHEAYHPDVILEGEQLLMVVLFRIADFVQKMKKEIERAFLGNPNAMYYATVEIEEMDDALRHLFLLEVVEYCKDHSIPMYHREDPHFACMKVHVLDDNSLEEWGLNDQLTINASLHTIRRITDTYKLTKFDFEYMNASYHSQSIPMDVSDHLYPLAPYMRAISKYTLRQSVGIQHDTGTYYIQTHRDNIKYESSLSICFKPKDQDYCYLMHRTPFFLPAAANNLAFAIEQTIIYNLLSKNMISKKEIAQIFSLHHAINSELP